MLVKLRTNWFGPSPVMERDGRVISGTLYKAGVHDFPDDFLEVYNIKFPSNAQILEGPAHIVQEPLEIVEDLKDYDIARAVTDSLASIRQEAEETIKENNDRRAESLAKARAAKAEKAKARKEEK